MERDQDGAGDYGYDLVHEEVGRAAGGPPAAPSDQEGGASTVRRDADDSGDLGYDEAHDF
jgi:hypothetical protein